MHYFCFTEMSALRQSNLQKHGAQIPDESCHSLYFRNGFVRIGSSIHYSSRTTSKTNGGRSIKTNCAKVEMPELPDKTIVLEAETIYRIYIKYLSKQSKEKKGVSSFSSPSQ